MINSQTKSTPQNSGPTEDIADVRRRVIRKADQAANQIGTGRRDAITTGCGTGKTSAFLSALEARSARIRIEIDTNAGLMTDEAIEPPMGFHYLVQTTAAQFLIAEENASFRAERPRDAADPDYRISDSDLTPDQRANVAKFRDSKAGAYGAGPMCVNGDVVEATVGQSLSVYQAVCLPCKHLKTCGYERQKKELTAWTLSGGNVARVHQKLTNEGGLGLSDYIVIDENALASFSEAIPFTKAELDETVIFQALPDPDFAALVSAQLNCLSIMDGDLESLPKPEAVRGLLEKMQARRSQMEKMVAAMKGSKHKAVIAFVNSCKGNLLSRLITLYGQIKTSLDHGVRLGTLIKDDAGGFSIRNVRESCIKKSANVTALDASFSQEFYGSLLDPTRAFEVTCDDLDHNISVEHIAANTSKQHLVGATKSRRNRDARVNSLKERFGDRPALVVGSAAIIEKIKEDGSTPSAWKLDSFGGLRGTNAYEDMDQIATIGSSAAPVSHYEAQIAAIYLATGCRAGIERYDAGKDGTYLPVDETTGLYRHPDDKVDRFIKSVIDEDIVQALGRVRAIIKDDSRPCRAVIIGQFFPDTYHEAARRSSSDGLRSEYSQYVFESLSTIGCVDLRVSAVEAKNLSERTLYRQKTLLPFSKERLEGILAVTFEGQIYRTANVCVAAGGRPFEIWYRPGMSKVDVEQALGFEFDLAIDIWPELPEGVSDPTDGSNPADNISVLHDPKGRATKTVRQGREGNLMALGGQDAAKIAGYDIGMHKTLRQGRIGDGVDGLEAMLRAASTRQQAFVIRGYHTSYYINGLDVDPCWHAGSEREMAGVRNTKDQFLDVPISWAAFDVDKRALPFGVDLVDDPEYAVDTVRRMMGQPFADTECVAQLTSSAGLQRDRVSVRFWFRLAVPLSGKQLGDCFERLDGSQNYQVGDVIVDGSIFQPQQPIYTASPRIQGYGSFEFDGKDIFADRIIRLEGSHQKLSIAPSPTIVKEREERDRNRPAVEPSQAARGFKRALSKIGPDSFHSHIKTACYWAAMGIEDGQIDYDTVIDRISAAIDAADPGHRPAYEVARYSSYRFLSDLLDWNINKMNKVNA